MRTTITLAVMLLGSTSGLSAQHAHQVSKYAGQEAREIKSLSAADIAELKRGGGWGLAKAAELNGMPGPIHLLELKAKIPLSDKQVASLTKLYNEMKAAASELGKQMIELERQLDQAFQDRSITDVNLRNILGKISQVRQRLRFTHLSTHLKTPAILTAEQIDRYNKLRGYGQSDPCATVPTGHNPAMWRKHNGCE